MPREETGWIKLYRQLLHHELWTTDRFTRGQAWVDLLLLANHTDGFIRVRGIKVQVKRGQVGWSEARLALRWKWSRSRVRRFLLDLQKEQQIEQQKSYQTSIITILNYDQYQQSEQQNEQENRHQANSKKTAKRQHDDPKTDTSEANSEDGFRDSANSKKTAERNGNSPKTNTNKKTRKQEIKKRDQERDPSNFFMTPTEVEKTMAHSPEARELAKLFWDESKKRGATGFPDGFFWKCVVCFDKLLKRGSKDEIAACMLDLFDDGYTIMDSPYKVSDKLAAWQMWQKKGGWRKRAGGIAGKPPEPAPRPTPPRFEDSAIGKELEKRERELLSRRNG